MDASEKLDGQTLDTPCEYCGATPRQTHYQHELDHFMPRGMSGGRSVIVLACRRCNRTKGGRIFESLEDAQRWLHRRYWTSGRASYIEHRPFAFGGKPPADLDPGKIKAGRVARLVRLPKPKDGAA